MCFRKYCRSILFQSAAVQYMSVASREDILWCTNNYILSEQIRRLAKREGVVLCPSGHVGVVQHTVQEVPE